jgi:hypothetical protein
VEITLDLTAPETEVPSFAGTPDFRAVLPNVAGGISSTLPLKGAPGLVISFDPAEQSALSALKTAQRLHERYADNGLVVQGIALAELDAARAFARQNGLTFAIACSANPRPESLAARDAHRYGVITLYNRDGSVAYAKARPRPEDLRELSRRAAALMR